MGPARLPLLRCRRYRLSPAQKESVSVSVPVVVEFLEEDGVYMVSVPWLQGCRAWSDTLDEALRAIPDNIRAMLKARHGHGDPLPPPL